MRPDSNCLMVNQGLTPQFDALAPVVQQIMISHYATRVVMASHLHDIQISRRVTLVIVFISTVNND